MRWTRGGKGNAFLLYLSHMEHKILERELKALANKRRLAILKFLKKNKEASVGGIAQAIKLSFKSTSRHLAVLSGADILNKNQKGLEVYYQIASPTSPTTGRVISLL